MAKKYIYRILRADWDYDQYKGFVIIASSEKECREIAAVSHSDEGADIWFDPSTTVEIIKPKGESGIILSDYLAG